MFKKRTFLLSFGIIFGSLSMAQIAYANEMSNDWNMTQLSEGKNFSTSLSCKTPPAVAGFQNCQLKIWSVEDQSSSLKQQNTDKPSGKLETGTLVEGAKVQMEGGMPAHHHGLPTSPVVSWSEADKVYVIKGLKYSMPGDWFLSFYIEGPQITKTSMDEGKTLKDKVSFKFSI